MTCSPNDRIPVGISSCLLGETVRYDSGHKRDAYLADVLGRYFDYQPFCPEVGIGLGVPRPPIRLTGDPSRPRAVGARVAGIDVTDRLVDYARSAMTSCPRISGYLFKRGSPSCGMERVAVHDANGMPRGTSSGLYAGAVMRLRPLLPVEEEGRLSDPALRASFVERVYVYHRWQTLTEGNLTPAKLVDFHTRHKFLLLSHSEVHYRRIGRLVAEAGTRDIAALSLEYIEVLMEGLRRRATRHRHSNVLQHIMGCLNNTIDADDKAALAELIDGYRQGALPRVVPLEFIGHHVRRHPHEYVALQVYLNPFPAELGLHDSL